MAAMARVSPECTPGFMSHMLVVLKSFMEVEDLGWRLYDDVFREKMAATGVKQWGGVDGQVFQGTCWGLPKCNGRSLVVKQQGGGGVKRPLCTTRANVCWQFNDGWCRFGSSCKFPHKCEMCGGRHGRLKCGKNKA